MKKPLFTRSKRFRHPVSAAALAFFLLLAACKIDHSATCLGDNGAHYVPGSVMRRGNQLFLCMDPTKVEWKPVSTLNLR